MQNTKKNSLPSSLPDILRLPFLVLDPGEHAVPGQHPPHLTGDSEVSGDDKCGAQVYP